MVLGSNEKRSTPPPCLHAFLLPPHWPNSIEEIAAVLIFIHIYQTLNSGVLVALLKRLVSSVAVGINEIQLKVKDRMLCYGGWLVVRKNMRNVKTCPIEWW